MTTRKIQRGERPLHPPNKPLRGTKKGADPENPDPAKKKDTKKGQLIEVPPVRKKERIYPIVGLTGLLCNAWGPKSITEMIERESKDRLRSAKGKKVMKAKNPEEDYYSAFYTLGNDDPRVTGECRYGVPSAAFRKAMGEAALDIDGVTKAAVKRAIRIIPDVDDCEGPGLSLIWSHSKPKMHMAVCNVESRNGKKSPTMRYRPYFSQWKIALRIRWNADVFSEASVANLLNHAGFAIGLCEWRNEKDGTFGEYELDENGEVPVDEEYRSKKIIIARRREIAKFTS